MSDAVVTFSRLKEPEVPCAPGDEQTVWFRCPRHGHMCGPLIIAGRTGVKRDPHNKNGGVAQWDWDGDRDAPTLHPSVNCSSCWHGHIRKGRCVDVQGKDEPEPPDRTRA